jgi:hypothetical protein
MLGLVDAVELTLLTLDAEPARYERTALRLHARLAHDAGFGLDEASAALGLLAALRGRHRRVAAYALTELLGSRGAMLQVADVVRRWADREAFPSTRTG